MCLSTLNFYIKSLHKTIFSIALTFQNIVVEANTTFCPELLQILTEINPPTRAFFEELPVAERVARSVYAVVLKKENSRSKLYIESATAAKYDLKHRMGKHDRRKGILSQHTRQALRDGFKIAFKGVLAYMPIPTAANVPKYRAACLVSSNCALLMKFFRA